MMPLQRVRIAESRIRNKLSNGPLRAQSNMVWGSFPGAAGLWSILRRGGIRQLPGICRYPAKCAGSPLRMQGGTADSVLFGILFVLDRCFSSVRDVFYFQK